MARIESDIQGADANLYVEFYSKAVKQEFDSQEANRPIFKDVTYVKIYTPSDQLTVIDTIAREDHKQRFPMQWQRYMNKHADDMQVVGTPVTAWPFLTAAQAEELKALKFQTVEMLANANDQQLQRIGMVAGVSGYTLRDKAKAFLTLADESAEVAKRDEELAKLREENAKIKAETEAKLAQMQDQMAAILAAVGEKKPKSRKKAETEVEEQYVTNNAPDGSTSFQ